MNKQTVLVDKLNFLDWRFREDDDKDFFLGDLIYDLKREGKYSIDLEEVLSMTEYVPMYCINNWEHLNLDEKDEDEEELYFQDERFDFKFDGDENE
tara:strand:- start:269 stop:556 length:288 start_codon:yes stop_codon:yes gene_type:complete